MIMVRRKREGESWERRGGEAAREGRRLATAASDRSPPLGTGGK